MDLSSLSIVSPGEKGGSAVPDVPEAQPDVFDALTKDFKRLKAQKARPTGGVEGSVLLNLCMLNDEQYVDYRRKTLSLEKRDENKLYLTFNLMNPAFNKLMGRLSAFNATFKANPDRKDPQALEDAEIVDRMILATDEKVDEISRMRERLYWLLVGGTAFEYVPWVPNATIEPQAQFDESNQLLWRDLLQPPGQSQPVSTQDMQVAIQSGRPAESFEPWEEVETVGEVGSNIFGPFNVFIDQTVRSVADLSPDQWVHIAQIRTLGWINETYPDMAGQITPQKDLSLISSRINADGVASGGVYLKDLIPLVQGSVDDHDQEMVIHVESYQPASQKYPKGRYICWVPEQMVLHEAEDGIPYEEIPLVDFHFTPVVTSFWTKSYLTPLVSAQRFINKRMSQLGEQSNATLYASLLAGPGIDANDVPTDFPGVVKDGLNEAGQPMLQRLAPPELPMWFLPSLQQAIALFKDAAGGADLMEQGQFPGQLRGPMAVPMLQEILDTQWGPLFQHLGERLARVKQMRLNRVKQFYPPMRTMHYTDRDQKNEVMQFHTEKILRSNTNFNISVQRGSILPELRSLREARVSERLAGPLQVLYMDERTGRLDKSKIAADLQFGDTGREAKESQERKLAQELNKMLWQGYYEAPFVPPPQPGQPPPPPPPPPPPGVPPMPPVQPFYNHNVMLDELESAMKTLEFVKASPQIQQAFSNRWQKHMTYAQQAAQAQQAGMQNHMIQSAVAQATQQAAATAAAEAVHEAMAQVKAQAGLPTDQYVAHAEAQQGIGAGRGIGTPSQAAGAASKTSTLKKKTTIEEHEPSSKQ